MVAACDRLVAITQHGSTRSLNAGRRGRHRDVPLVATLGRAGGRRAERTLCGRPGRDAYWSVLVQTTPGASGPGPGRGGPRDGPGTQVERAVRPLRPTGLGRPDQAGAGPRHPRAARSTPSSRPGDAIPSERALVTRLGVSRVTVRQAIADLVEGGVLERVHGKGTYVTGPAGRLPAAPHLVLPRDARPRAAAGHGRAVGPRGARRRRGRVRACGSGPAAPSSGSSGCGPPTGPRWRTRSATTPRRSSRGCSTASSARSTTSSPASTASSSPAASRPSAPRRPTRTRPGCSASPSARRCSCRSGSPTPATGSSSSRRRPTGPTATGSTWPSPRAAPRES